MLIKIAGREVSAAVEPEWFELTTRGGEPTPDRASGADIRFRADESLAWYVPLPIEIAGRTCEGFVAGREGKDMIARVRGAFPFNRMEWDRDVMRYG